MIRLRAQFMCDHCKTAEEFWVDRFCHVPSMASRATNGSFSGVRPRDFATAAEMCGKKVMTLVLCKDCCAKFKGRFSYAPGVL